MSRSPERLRRTEVQIVWPADSDDTATTTQPKVVRSFVRCETEETDDEDDQQDAERRRRTSGKIRDTSGSFEC